MSKIDFADNRNPPALGDECIAELNLDTDVVQLYECLNSDLGTIHSFHQIVTDMHSSFMNHLFCLLINEVL